MTCFWDAIINHLQPRELILLGLNARPNPKLLCKMIHHKRQLIDHNILWQGKPLSLTERREHLKTIQNEPCHVTQGHLTSSCDSFLLFICHLCKINITHRSTYGVFQYLNPKATRTITLYSNKGHMW